MKFMEWIPVLMIAGCATNYQGMTPEQINAAIKDKSSAVNCYTFVGAGGQGGFVIINNDKGTFPEGHILVKPGSNCETEITTTRTVQTTTTAPSTTTTTTTTKP